MRQRSARRLLVAVLVAAVSLVGASAAALSWREGRIEADELFDAKLAHSARVLAALTDPEVDATHSAAAAPLSIRVWHGAVEGEGDALVTAAGHAYETRLAFQVRDDAGRLLLRSDSGPQERLAPLAPGFVDATIDGEAWRVFTLRSARAHWVQAAERADIREEIAADIALGTMVPMGVALPLLALLVWAIVNWAGRGLARVSAQVERRAADSLDPLSPDGVPEELRGLVAAIDGLLARLRGALSRERHFIADAAHELRTPLAALRVHAANLRTATDAPERARAQRRLDEGIARMERLVSQLLELEREEGAAGAPARLVSLDVVACARREIAELGVAGLDRGIALELVAPDTLVVEAEEPGVSALLRNLLDNALRYTPEGSSVVIRVEPAGEVVRLLVDDSGPGIAEDARERVLERFHRGLGHAATGSGLGLSIVQRVVERHAGRMRLDAAGCLAARRTARRGATARLRGGPPRLRAQRQATTALRGFPGRAAGPSPHATARRGAGRSQPPSGRSSAGAGVDRIDLSAVGRRRRAGGTAGLGAAATGRHRGGEAGRGSASDRAFVAQFGTSGEHARPEGRFAAHVFRGGAADLGAVAHQPGRRPMTTRGDQVLAEPAQVGGGGEASMDAGGRRNGGRGFTTEHAALLRRTESRDATASRRAHFRAPSGNGGASAWRLGKTEQAQALVPDHGVALASGALQRRPIADPDATAAVFDDPLQLQLARGVGNALASHAEHVGDHFLGDAHVFAGQAVEGHQQPPPDLLVDGVVTVADRGLRDLREQCLVVEQNHPSHFRVGAERLRDAPHRDP